MLNKIFNEDCLEWMKRIPDGSIDCIITDPPYWTTACKWDTIIPFEPMWEQLKRIIKPNWAIVLFGSQPFTSNLIMSNIKEFRYNWIWEKYKRIWFATASRRPMTSYEEISIFYKKQPTYNPQWLQKLENPYYKTRNKPKKDTITPWENDGSLCGKPYLVQYTWYPHQRISFASESKSVHPTQKPVALIEYLIKTYTNEWETVLDFTMWSGTTAIAAINTNRNYIGFEMDKWYFDIAQERITKHLWSI